MYTTTQFGIRNIETGWCWFFLITPNFLRFLIPQCGNLCGEATFRTLDRLAFSIFVPEAGCPIHDSED